MHFNGKSDTMEEFMFRVRLGKHKSYLWRNCLNRIGTGTEKERKKEVERLCKNVSNKNCLEKVLFDALECFDD